MSRWLLTLLLILSPISLAGSEISSRGSVSDEEAALLWKKGQESLHNSKFQDATNALQRLVDRYPGYEGYHTAHLLLGQALLGLGRAKEAIAPLKDYIESSPPLASHPLHLESAFGSIAGRLALGWAYVRTNLPSEACLTALEIETLAKTTTLPKALHTEMLLLKSAALLALDRLTEAKNASDAAIQSLAEVSDPLLRAKVYSQELRLKTSFCAQLGNPESWKRMGNKAKLAVQEIQIRDQLKRRATCLQEALLTYRKVLETQSHAVTREAEKLVSHAYQAYSEATLFNPFSLELRDQLYKEYKSSTTQAVDLLTSWKQSLSPKMLAALESLSKQLQTTAKGTP